MGEESINITEIIDSLKKRYKMIIAITLAFTIISGLISFFVIKPKYEVNVKLFIGKENSKTQEYNNNDVQMYQKLMSTYAEIIKTDDLMEKALNSSSIDKSVVKAKAGLKVTPRADTQILEIGYTSTNKDEALTIVKNITDEFVKDSKKLIPNGNIQIIEKAKLPEKPVSPNKKLNILIAFALGLMVSVGLALILEFMDNSFRSKEDLEKVLDIPVLGIIPELDSDAPSNKRGKHERVG